MGIETIKMDAKALADFFVVVFPQVHGDFGIDEITPDGCRMRLHASEKHLRPGGTVSGPAMFGLADVAMYVAVLSRIGPEALTVTTNCSIDFMRKPEAGRDLGADTRLLKLGRSLAVGDVLRRSEGTTAIVARASLTYAIPPNRTPG